ncbi:MAG: glycosyltransferase family 39 protein [Gemmatimonadaceae bacterium]|nr:glycosyltransferase family 39 protein [Gemmatimonadaceae bacterium]
MSTRNSAGTAIGWALLFLAGFAAALSLISAGPALAYQHYLPLRAFPNHPLSVAVLAVQVILVPSALRADIGRLYVRVVGLLPGWRLPVFVMAMAGSSAVVGRDIPRFVSEIVTSSLIQLLSLGTLVLVVRALPPDAARWLDDRFGRLLGGDLAFGDKIAPRIDRFAITTAVGVTAACLLLYVVAYNRHPHIPDEVAYLFQARTFASGRLTVPNPPVPSAFGLYLFESGANGWFTPVPPGWPAALVPGVLIGAPWLVNPVLTGVNVLLLYLVLQPLYGRRVTRLATLLFATSPWNVFLGMSFMPHALTMWCALAATLGVMLARRTGQARWALCGGLALGVAASVRQLDAMIMAAALGLWAIGLGGRRLRLSGTAGLVLGSLLATAPLLAFNRFFTGKVSTFPMMTYIDRVYGKGANDYGFGKDRGMGWALDPNPGHGPIDGIINAALNTSTTQVELFGWSVGSLLLVYAFVLRGRLSTADRLMLGLVGITWLAYFFNYYSGGPDFGARYWFLMIVPFVALTSRGALTLLAPDAMWGVSETLPGRVDSRGLTAIALLVLGSWLIFVPWRAVDKYRFFRGMRPDLATMSTRYGFGRGLVLIAGREFPDFASAATYNPLDLDEAVPVYARRTGPATDSAVIAAFADRPVWLVDGPTVSGQRFTVRAGPLSTSEALASVRAPLSVP